MSKKLECAYVGVLIEKSIMNIIPKTVPKHEIRILRLLHGMDKVSVDKGVKVGEPKSFEVSDEYQRLVETYGIDNVVRAYGEQIRPDFETCMEDYEELIEMADQAGPVPHIEYKIHPSKLMADGIREELEKLEIDYPCDATRDELESMLCQAWGMELEEVS